ncbi:hypothetical protein M1M11_20925 [Pseudomonas azerbaijanoccidens]|uniref:Uncharacterized protein n=1 Tax=Pseudomonas fluorescens TaxID=294 RepID=A0A5E7A7N0_PSEFL|nr:MULTISPECIES: hypothetical protein [Pseudomonas]MCK8667346.1 hypothetical protein [Pseudomonas azerbaijanoccidentalis]VVN74896.1 hypothetical protein PS712_00666 [Pseudomonas fluorescens]
MRVMPRKGRKWWCKTIVKVSILLLFFYWLISEYFYWDRVWEARENSHKELVECRKKLSDSKYLPILGGGLLDVSKLHGFFWSVKMSKEGCVGDNLEGSFWWTGTELRNTYDEVGKNNDQTGWSHFTVVARLFLNVSKTSPHSTGYKQLDWPDELTIKLKNYPGLELWLKAPPPSVENKFLVSHFILHDWRRRDGTPRYISCDGLDSPRVEGSGLHVEDLIKFDRGELENLDFGSFRAYCNVGLSSFNFAAGDARVNLGVESLRSAPQALKFINDYLSRSVVTGSNE